MVVSRAVSFLVRKVGKEMVCFFVSPHFRPSTWLERYAIGGQRHTFNSVQSVVTTWRTRELVRRERN
jgi:hypothetical protein